MSHLISNVDFPTKSMVGMPCGHLAMHILPHGSGIPLPPRGACQVFSIQLAGRRIKRRTGISRGSGLDRIRIIPGSHSMSENWSLGLSRCKGCLKMWSWLGTALQQYLYTT